MEAPLKDCTTLEQRAVIRFLNAEGIQTSQICQRMKNIYQHPEYSPDLAPSDFFLFGLLKKELKGKRFDSDEDVQKVVQEFFHTLPKSAYKEGIYKFPERWRRCIESQALARLRSGHIKTLKFQNGQKTFNNCLKCNSAETSPEHILSCSELTIEDLFSRPITTILKLERNKSPEGCQGDQCTLEWSKGPRDTTSREAIYKASIECSRIQFLTGSVPSEGGGEGRHMCLWLRKSGVGSVDVTSDLRAKAAIDSSTSHAHLILGRRHPSLWRRPLGGVRLPVRSFYAAAQRTSLTASTSIVISQNKFRPGLTRAISPKPWSPGGCFSVFHCYRWFKKFQSGDFKLDNEPRGKPPQKFEEAELQALLDEDSTQTQEKLAKQLQVSQGAVSLRLNSLEMTQKLSRWVPHELSERQQERRLVTCEGLLTRHEKNSFLHRIVTSDEKWIHFSNPMRQKS
ncbi:CNOT6L [Cordylochernes scorpioides]|uniref:CNOT6L n=1 Tax=Cordylochernes scorpioides TaxID=51811 RepID=A0ABY6KP38_9ARAC|nr:CNOT6L [Cordylochernes scorpioides]